MSISSLESGDFFRIVESMIYGALVVGQSSIFTADFTKAKLAAFNIFKLIDRRPLKMSVDEDQQNGVKNGMYKHLSEKLNPENQQKGKNIAFDKVHFSYPNRPNTTILNGLSFSAQSGQTVALIGESGCGKSTTIQLLERFYDPVKGEIVSFGKVIEGIPEFPRFFCLASRQQTSNSCQC